MIKIIKFFLIIIIILSSMLWTYENVDVIDSLKGKLKKYISKSYKIENILEDKKNIEANAYEVSITKLVDLKDKTAFVTYDTNNKIFDVKNISVYLQNGYLITQDNSRKLKLNNNYTLEFNGGLKAIFFNDKKTYGLISSAKKDCYYSAIIDLENGNEIFTTDCLPDLAGEDLIDFNGMGSSVVYLDDYILLSLGTPTTNAKKIEDLAQNKNSYFGKILKIKKSDLTEGKINPDIFSLGHRNPQGITKFKNEIFSVEHGPKGGDELNKIKMNFNYGWPNVSYGTRYLYNEEGLSYKINHEDNGYTSPLFSFIPSIGISAINQCPSILKNYYKTNCLIALSLNGNNLRPGNSLIIFLLDNNLEKVQAVEKIFISTNYALRHFVTDKSNNIFEDNDGSIYVSIDNKGIYKIEFKGFR